MIFKSFVALEYKMFPISSPERFQFQWQVTIECLFLSIIMQELGEKVKEAALLGGQNLLPVTSPSGRELAAGGSWQQAPGLGTEGSFGQPMRNVRYLPLGPFVSPGELVLWFFADLIPGCQVTQ
jgi:hypothetical protein